MADQNVSRRSSDESLFVELWSSRLPIWAWFAEHNWLVVLRPQQIDRWEIWQHADKGGQSWGHLHRNLFAADTGVRQNPSTRVHRWVGDQAIELAQRIESSPQVYPWCQTYRYAPGPNSNTYVQWCLQDRYRLGWRAIGRGFQSVGKPRD
ncbi:DUF3750 domain-containing protein [Stieleria sp. TO1_6]|uniref:DUF3750 domain-containing protein n=1 Tax=Stieleria tagensis TaxID=2956795 RepID=UPI00209B1461|nr:DUF3750 domain-containing protein [Stieleria tagensis]MCO8124824.1 DUF3750 domain-containing protein [Stieleria tagensis]